MACTTVPPVFIPLVPLAICMATPCSAASGRRQRIGVDHVDDPGRHR